MPAYKRELSAEYEEIDRWDGGVGWIAHPNEEGERASHAILGDEGVWIIDPVDVQGIDDLVKEYGEVRGVAVLSSYHARDADQIAHRYGVSVHIPRWMNRVPERVDAPVKRETEVLGGAGFETFQVEPLSMYQEAIAYREEDGTLIVPDLLSSGSSYPVGDERIGLMLGIRPFPPRDLFEDIEPERILFGHGEGVFQDAGEALDKAITGARKRFPRALVENFRTNFRLYIAAMKE